MTGGMRDGIPKGPVRVLELLDRPQNHLLKNAHYVGRAIDEEQPAFEAAKRVGGICGSKTQESYKVRYGHEEVRDGKSIFGIEQA